MLLYHSETTGIKALISSETVFPSIFSFVGDTLKIAAVDFEPHPINNNTANIVAHRFLFNT